MYPGGNCLNVAVHARRAGAQTGFVGAVADDAAGRLMRAALRAEGVDTARLRVVPGLTAYCVIGHQGAERLFLAHDLGVSRFAPDAGDLDHAAGFDAAHVGQSSGLDAHLPAIAARTRLSYDFSTRREAEHRAAIVPLCWLAAFSLGDLDEDAADRIIASAAGAVWVLATRGSAGATLRGPGGRFDVAAARVAAVDTLGAGDTFIAHTLTGLLAGRDPARVLAAAAAAAAVTCGYHGAIGHGVPIDLPVPLPAVALPD
jgi:fructoselysine 6-kinase